MGRDPLPTVPSLVNSMNALPCILSLLALQGDLKPLAEEKQLVDTEQAALEFSRLEVAELGTIGWTKTTVTSGQMDGAPCYLVHRLGEVADFAALKFNSIESRGLFNADFQLVHEFRSQGPLGEDAELLELEWRDDGFRWREGRGRWNTVEGDTRPTTETDIPLFVQGLAVSTPWVGYIFNEKSKELQTQTLQTSSEATVDDEPMRLFGVEGPVPMEHRLTPTGVYMGSQLEELRIVGMQPLEDIELRLRKGVADSPGFERVVDQNMPTGWTEKKGDFTHPILEMSLELAEGWNRAPADEVDGTLFQAYSPDANAYFSLELVVLGTGYTLDDWSEGLLQVHTELAVDGDVKMKKKSFAKQDAICMELVRAGDARLDTTVYAWKRNGFGFLATGGTWDESPKKLHKETAKVLKSVSFGR